MNGRFTFYSRLFCCPWGVVSGAWFRCLPGLLLGLFAGAGCRRPARLARGLSVCSRWYGGGECELFSRCGGYAPARLPWGTGAAAFAVAALVLSYLQIHRHDIPTIVTDALIGAAAACFLVSATRCLTDPGQFAAHWGLRLCASRGAVRLGTFSYSLYLVHAPVVAIVHNIVGLFALPPVGVLLALFAFGVPLSLAAGYVFYRLFERPFLPGHPRSDAEAAVVSPAP